MTPKTARRLQSMTPRQRLLEILTWRNHAYEDEVSVVLMGEASMDPGPNGAWFASRDTLGWILAQREGNRC